MGFQFQTTVLLLVVVFLFSASPAHAFGAGNIASISAVEGKNWRHGDIEDILKTVACIKGHKWTSMMIKRVYFGNWLRDYSQAMDTGALSKVQPETIRILVWLLSFLGFGYATGEFEVTSERLGVYRPEEHIDNPKDYNDNKDARVFDPRLRGPIRPIELQVDPETGMKNYIANQKGDWATSAAFVKYSFERSIHYGRLYTNGHGLFKGKDEDLAEALRCLGQGLHTLEDFGAHTNYVELALREQGFNNVFPHTGTGTQINLHGKHVFPLVTGTFGMVDFYHSVLGEATDHFTQSEVNEMDNALGTAQQASQSSSPVKTLVSLLSKVPGTRDLCNEAEQLQRASEAQAQQSQGNQSSWGNQNQNQWGDQGGWRGVDDNSYNGSSRAAGDWNAQPAWNAHQGGPPQDHGGYNQQQGWDQHQQQDWNQQSQWNQPQHDQAQNYGQQHQADPTQQQQQTPAKPGQGLPGMPNFDPAKTIAQIYPILAFRDKVVRSISAVIEKIPGLEALVEKITETLTVFILSLLAPFIRPIIDAISKALQDGSNTVVDSSGKHQYEPWTDPTCTDPTHSLLSKDHFSNILNPPAGAVAAEILKHVAPRVLYAWQHPNVPVDQVMNDCMKVFHHPALRDNNVEAHRNMFEAVKKWVHSRSDKGRGLNDILSSESVRAGKNHKTDAKHDGHTHNAAPSFGDMGLPGAGFAGSGYHQQQQSHSGWGGQQQQHQGGSSGSGGFDPLAQLSQLPIPGIQNLSKFSSFIPGGFGGFGGSKRDIGDDRGVDDFEGTLGTRGMEPEPRNESTSPFPVTPGPPTGYEQYGQHYTGGDYQPSGQDPSQHDYLSGQGSGGQSNSYYRG